MDAVVKFVVVVVFGLFSDWIAMLVIGAAHSHDARVPAFGFWTVFFLTWAVGCAMTPSFLTLSMKLDER